MADLRADKLFKGDAERPVGGDHGTVNIFSNEKKRKKEPSGIAVPLAHEFPSKK